MNNSPGDGLRGPPRNNQPGNNQPGNMAELDGDAIVNIGHELAADLLNRHALKIAQFTGSRLKSKQLLLRIFRIFYT